MRTIECPKCGALAMEQSERADVCTACGYFFYYRDAYAEGDNNREGYDPEFIKRNDTC